ncbi:hypothetical protein GCM10023322_19810 [Rugosimonospora acidiphila]|uniref:DUF4179 domain-containing protein n=1 Tax=Rugosimonospora acidiphila TaxID=556531 RepID=A0ABP9RQR0_9ACTN
MTDLEEILIRTLEDRATPEVPIERLLTVTRERGRRRQRLRRVAGLSAGGALTVAALVGAAVTVPALATHQTRATGTAGAGGGPATAVPSAAMPSATMPSATVGPSAPTAPFSTTDPRAGLSTLTGLPALPVAAGAVIARTDPAVVGSDPLLLHFEVDPAVLPAQFLEAEWRSLDGLEDLNVQTTKALPFGDPGFKVQVSHQAQDLDKLSSGGRRAVRVGATTGTLSLDQSQGISAAELRWQPVPGLWAQVQVTGGESAALRVANAVGFDRVSRCVVPFRLTSVPAGASVDSCAVAVMTSGATGLMSLHLPPSASGGASAGSDVTVEVDRGVTVTKPNQKVGGRPAMLREYQGDAKHPVLQLDVDHAGYTVDLLAEGQYDPAVILDLANGFQDAGSPDPRTWPADSLG